MDHLMDTQPRRQFELAGTVAYNLQHFETSYEAWGELAEEAALHAELLDAKKN